MITVIRVRGAFPTNDLRALLNERVEQRLGRFAAELLAVNIRIVDVNGPRRGVDMHALVHVAGARIGTVTVEDIDESPVVAVDRALDRIAQVVSRALDRQRARRRERPRLPLSSHVHVS